MIQNYTNNSFPAMNTFAECDHLFMAHPTCKKIVETRYALKLILGNAPRGADLVAKGALEALTPPSMLTLTSSPKVVSKKNLTNKEEPHDYLLRKIEGFSKKNTHNEGFFSPDLIANISNAVKNFHTAFSNLKKPKACLLERVSTPLLFGNHSAARKAYKEEVKDLFNDLHKQNPERPLNDLLPLAQRILRREIAVLEVDDTTKDYLDYKIGYVFEDFKKQNLIVA